VSYRRFQLRFSDLHPATVATSATVRPEAPKSVATVANVAALGGAGDILSAYERMFEACIYGSITRQIRIVERFLEHHWPEADALSWSDVELFGCCPDKAFATVRYDCMGAVTIAALTATPITSVSASEVRTANGLSTRRSLRCRLAKPVWVVFADRDLPLS
jgi:hypothetical protein